MTLVCKLCGKSITKSSKTGLCVRCCKIERKRVIYNSRPDWAKYLKKQWSENHDEMVLRCKRARKASAGFKGRKHNDVTKQIISKKLKKIGVHPPWELSPCFKAGYKRDEVFGKEVDEQIRQATIISNQNRVVSIETRLKMRLKKLGKVRWPHSEETKQKIRESNIGKKRSLETIVKLKEHGKKYALEHPDIMAQKVQQLLENQNRKPTKPEMKLNEILQYYFPDKYRYVGNGQVWIARKNPDFIHNNDKKLIELYGTYWHKPEEMDKRIAHYSKYNFRTLIIWENELSCIDSLLERVNSFDNGENVG